MVINFILISNLNHRNLNRAAAQVASESVRLMIVSILFFAADLASGRKKSTDNNQSNSSNSSDEDKTSSLEITPFSLSSLQTLNPTKDGSPHLLSSSTELDQLYPAIDPTMASKIHDDEDDELLRAVAAATASITSVK